MKTINNELVQIFKNDPLTFSPTNIFRGKYRIGQFQLTDKFIVEYMKAIHGINIPNSWASGFSSNISDVNSQKVMYMECCNILTKNIMNEIRNVVKCPHQNMQIYRNNEHIVHIRIFR